MRQAVLLLALAGAIPTADGLAQTAQPGIPEIHARLVAMRFFSSLDTVPPRAVRLYSTRFEISATKYLNVELELAFPRPGRVVELPIACQFVKPDGSVLGTLDLNSTIQADWPDMIRSAGWGSLNGGSYGPGVYRARCSSGSTLLGEASFEMVQPPPEIATANAQFTALQFFETPRQMLALDQRRYRQSFTTAETRSIGVELRFDSPPPGREVSFVVQCRIWSPDGSVFGTFDINFTMQPDWKGIINAAQWGYEEAGKWTKGVYLTSCKTGDRWIADGMFEVR